MSSDWPDWNNPDLCLGLCIFLGAIKIEILDKKIDKVEKNLGSLGRGKFKQRIEIGSIKKLLTEN